MNEVKNICTVCGKLNPHPLWQFKPINEIAFTKIETPFFDRLQAAERAKYCSGHPEPAEKHDGQLNEEDTSHVYYNYCREVVIAKHGNSPSWLTPKEALSLLTWLRQEEAELQRLAKEQE